MQIYVKMTKAAIFNYIEYSFHTAGDLCKCLATGNTLADISRRGHQVPLKVLNLRQSFFFHANTASSSYPYRSTARVMCGLWAASSTPWCTAVHRSSTLCTGCSRCKPSATLIISLTSNPLKMNSSSM